jgi:hypothetical protein
MLGALSDLWHAHAPSVGAFALFATLVGWIISFRAQKALLRSQVRNAARAEIVKAMREQEDQLAPLKGILFRLIRDHRYWPNEQWEAESRKFATLPLGTAWLERLEEYEILFPQTRDVRLHLSGLSIDLIIQVGQFRDAFSNYGSYAAEALAIAPSLLARLDDRGAFIHDLLVFVQNETFRTLIKGSVFYRNPLEPKVPRIVLSQSSWLRRVVGREQPVLVFVDPKRLDAGPTAQ